jgi:hypothetical protein
MSRNHGDRGRHGGGWGGSTGDAFDDADDDADDSGAFDDSSDEWEAGDDSGDEPTVPCPYCRRELLEDSPWCPTCDRYITDEEFRQAGRPMWVVVTAVVCLAIALWWAFVSF